ncbi:MAG: SUMF1/EgtB/PvdO family nonheme iron enzyme [Acidobacteriota bacterium]
MRLCFAAIVLVFTLGCDGRAAAQRGVSRVTSVDGVREPIYAESYAVVVGINEYPRFSPAPERIASRGSDSACVRRNAGDLCFARSDAESVAALLEARGFEVRRLLDEQATRRNILSELYQLAGRLSSRDRVVFYFAGHGSTIRLGQSAWDDDRWGQIVPHDATNDPASRILMAELRILSRILGTAEHQLFILDTCFGGRLIKGFRTADNDLGQQSLISARHVLTAGGEKDLVIDGGRKGLTQSFLEAIGKGKADRDCNGLIGFSELEAYIQAKANNDYQTPRSGVLPGHEGGEFVFRNPQCQQGDSPPGLGWHPEPSEGPPRIEDPMLGGAFRLIKPGTFYMGSPEGEPGSKADEQRHKVRLTRAFWIAETEVTQRQWESFKANESDPSICPSCPIHTVMWFEAVAFANWLSQRAELEPCYELEGAGQESVQVRFKGLDCLGYRLPTEAEWEYAARAGTSTAFATGESLGPESALFATSPSPFPAEAHASPLTEVGLRRSNSWGLFDMHGSVAEWTWDVYAPQFLVEQTEDPIGPEAGSKRVIRGGSWKFGVNACRSAARDANVPQAATHDVGLRLVRTESLEP